MSDGPNPLLVELPKKFEPGDLLIISFEGEGDPGPEWRRISPGRFGMLLQRLGLMRKWRSYVRAT